MRKLTQQEIDGAPEWATHYAIIEDIIRWSDHECFKWNHDTSHRMKHDNIFLVNPVPIPRKEFDIDPYKLWIDPVFDNDGHATKCYYTKIKRAKAIDMAKHFKLTPDDLS